MPGCFLAAAMHVTPAYSLLCHYRYRITDCFADFFTLIGFSVFSSFTVLLVNFPVRYER